MFHLGLLPPSSPIKMASCRMKFRFTGLSRNCNVLAAQCWRQSSNAMDLKMCSYSKNNNCSQVKTFFNTQCWIVSKPTDHKRKAVFIVLSRHSYAFSLLYCELLSGQIKTRGLSQHSVYVSTTGSIKVKCL